MRWALPEFLTEAARKRRTAYKSGRREIFGLGTRPGERAGEVRVRVKRKRPKRGHSAIGRTMFKKRARIY